MAIRVDTTEASTTHQKNRMPDRIQDTPKVGLAPPLTAPLTTVPTQTPPSNQES